jgi:hypothetical protein
MPCDVDSEGEACVVEFVDEFGERAFRRPLQTDERDGFVSLYGTLEGDGVQPRVAVSAVIASILQSPQFLYQLDVGAPVEGGETPPDRYALTDHELASHLSYLLVDAPPDDTLQQLAAAGALSDTATFREQAERLLDDSRGRQTLKRFVAEWFDVEGVDYSTRVDPLLADAMVEEIDRNLDDWLFADPRPIGALLTSGTGQVNGELAMHYDLGSSVSSSSDWQQVTFPDHYQGGLLTKALVAARYSNLQAPSIILRGVFVLRDLLCIELGAPPDGAVDDNPQLPEDAMPREKFEARAEMAQCAGCHAVIDPIGIGMEELDHLGRYRVEYESGEPVDNDGTLQVLSPPEFNGTAALAQALGESEHFVQCAALKFSQYALGESSDEQPCGAEALVQALPGPDAGVRDLPLTLVESERFRFRRRSLAGGSP